MFIGGEWKESSTTTAVINPSTEESIADVAVASADDVNAAVNAAKAAQRDWGRRPAVERGDFLRRWADLIDRGREKLARTITQEEGKPPVARRCSRRLAAGDPVGDPSVDRR